MRVAHFVIITPGRCGLYETTRELVAGLRERGIDSRMFDPTQKTNKLYPEGTEDRGAVFCGEDWMKHADVWVCHSGLGEWEGKYGKPVVLVAHGRPRHSFLSEKTGSTPIYSYHYNKNKDPDFRAVVTFWPEHVPYLEFMFPDTVVECVPSCVDLGWWSEGDTNYDFAGKSGTINAVITDSWRDDVDPFVPINAFGLWARSKETDIKLHIYAKPHNEERGWAALTKRLKDDGILGVYQGWAKDLRVVYRAADMALTGNLIDVRTVREAMACGCPVVKFPSADISKFPSKLSTALTVNRSLIRKQAEGIFNPARTAERFAGILGNALHKTECHA